jgi:hypothetical protein
MIKYFKTNKEVNQDIKELLKDIKCNCNSTNLYAVINERADASYDYLIICSKCKNILGKIKNEKYEKRN